MKIFDRYIGRTVLSHTLTVMLVLLSMYFFSTLIDELGNVGKGRYATATALQYCLMLIPRQAYDLFPMVALLGGMLGLGTLASSNELTVIRAAGVSTRRIMLSVMKMALLLMVVMALIGEFLAPALEQKARMMRAAAMTKTVSLSSEAGLWARDGSTFIHIKRLLPDGLATDVALYVLDEERRLREMVRVKQAKYQADGWMLHKVSKSVISEDGIGTQTLPDQLWPTTLTPEVINVAVLPPDKLAIWELVGYINYTRANGLDAGIYELSLWTRLVAPFATGGMMMLAVPFIFGSLRSTGIGLRITVGGLLGIGFYLFNGVFGRIAIVYDLSPALSAIIPTLVVYGLWLAMMRRVQ